MKIGIITIGSELLNGSRVDTNAHWIAKNVILFGGEVISKKSILDNESDIALALDYFLKTPIEMILITGGLGPTHDDITANSLYEYFNDDPIFDSSYWDKLNKIFTSKGLDVSNLNKSQAFIPKKGEIIPNNLGTARGLSYNHKNARIIAMPGVPKEMKSMMNESVLPLIQRLSKISINYKTLRTTGISESKLFNILEKAIGKFVDVNIAFLPSFLGVDLRISGHNKISFDIALKEILACIEYYIYSQNNEPLEEVVSKMLIEKKITISTAESCTGGHIADRLTNISGVSSVYKGSVVAYSNDQKIKLLHVDEKTLKEHGAVSEETAVAMAIGVQKKFATNIGISTTGIAGPGGGTAKKPVGLVYIGFAYNGLSKAYKFNFKYDRVSNKMISAQVALNIIRKNLEKLDK